MANRLDELLFHSRSGIIATAANTAELALLWKDLFIPIEKQGQWNIVADDTTTPMKICLIETSKLTDPDANIDHLWVRHGSFPQRDLQGRTVTPIQWKRMQIMMQGKEKGKRRRPSSQTQP